MPVQVTGAAEIQWGPVGVWAGATSTFIVATVALLAALDVFGKREQPRLKLTFEQTQPWCRHVDRDGQRFLWVRIGVQNDGVAPALGCIGRLTRLASDGQARIDIDPLQLRWAGVPRSRSFDPIDLRRGQREFINVLFQPEGGDWAIDTFSDEDFDPGFPTELEAGRSHQLLVAMFAENATTQTLTLRLRPGENGPILTGDA